jgi:4-diphosphocytidyl-2-C-methyl-D-erythritol kinase
VKRLRVKAPAKVNLYLRVLGSRPDGYHDLETVFQTIDLHDRLIISKTKGQAGIEVPGFPDLEGESNLAMRALRRLERRLHTVIPAKFILHKEIPSAAGLGGGSSDAAAALVGIRALFGLDVTDEELAAEALALGADVPYFLTGGAAVGEGVGERLTSIELPTDYRILLVNPGFPVSTATVFREFSRTLTGSRREGTLWKLLRERTDPEALLHNDLEAVAAASYTEIREAKKWLAAMGLRRSLMTGSGPTVFALVRSDETEAISCSHPEGWRTFWCRPVRWGVIVE